MRGGHPQTAGGTAMKEIRIVPFGAQHVAAVAELEQVCFADP